MSRARARARVLDSRRQSLYNATRRRNELSRALYYGRIMGEYITILFSRLMKYYGHKIVVISDSVARRTPGDNTETTTGIQWGKVVARHHVEEEKGRENGTRFHAELAIYRTTLAFHALGAPECGQLERLLPRYLG